MSQYHTFTAHDAVAYAQTVRRHRQPHLSWSARRKWANGNLNLVF
ncbi:5-methylthioribose kinase [Klebsiella pneumoniae]|uniref:5-methylthioribose kinase n=1 Tax=Klebsiella pneumoniae TaxID=573 RepID=A0A447S2R6_KLEPN|nr:5-methylthioribose kinase [Klebsiella pneumoniae]